jgi:hypothetical protein
LNASSSAEEMVLRVLVISCGTTSSFAINQ